MEMRRRGARPRDLWPGLERAEKKGKPVFRETCTELKNGTKESRAFDDSVETPKALSLAQDFLGAPTHALRAALLDRAQTLPWACRRFVQRPIGPEGPAQPTVEFPPSKSK